MFVVSFAGWNKRGIEGNRKNEIILDDEPVPALLLLLLFFLAGGDMNASYPLKVICEINCTLLGIRDFMMGANKGITG